MGRLMTLKILRKVFCNLTLLEGEFALEETFYQ